MATEGDAARALIADLRKQLAEALHRLADKEQDYSVRTVTDYQIGQMVLLGLETKDTIYMQVILNAYDRLLQATTKVFLHGDKASYWISVIREAIAKADPRVFE